MGAMLAQGGASGLPDGADQAAGAGDVGPTGIRAAWARDPELTELWLEVVAAGSDANGAYLDLPDSLFYPGGGGQPPDGGWVGDQALAEVELTAAGHWRHHLRAAGGEGGADGDAVRPEPGRPVRLRLDWPRRFDHMQQHSAQHLLSAIAEDRFGWRTSSFHLGPEVSDIELAVPQLSEADLRALEEAASAAIRQAPPLRERLVEPAELAGLRVRSRGLPAGHRGLVRLVEIEGYDLATCGGTHVGNLAQVEGLALLGSEPLRGGQRLHWVAGGRIRRRLARQEALLAALRRELKAPDEALPEAAARLLLKLDEAHRDSRALESWLLDRLLAGLLADPRPWPWLHDLRLGRELQRELGKQLLQQGRSAFLSGGEAPHAWLLVLPDGPSAPRPPEPQLLRGWIEALGRGGGRPPFVQGQAADLAGLEEAAARLQDWPAGPG